MKITNNLKRLLEELGIKTMIPTEELLSKKLGGMSLIRFNKIYNNSAVMEPLTAVEADNLKKWVASITRQSATDIVLFDSVEKEKEAMS